MIGRRGLLLPTVLTLLTASTQLSAHSEGTDNVIRGKFGEQQSYCCDIFVSYSKEDQKYWDRINKYLVGLDREGFKIRSHYMVEAGTVIEDSVRAALLESAVVVLLMSQDYIASDLMKREFPALLDQVEENHACILWLKIGVFDPTHMERLTRYQKVGGRSPPLDSISPQKRNDIYLDLVNAIRKRLSERKRFPNPSCSIPEET